MKAVLLLVVSTHALTLPPLRTPPRAAVPLTQRMQAEPKPTHAPAQVAAAAAATALALGTALPAEAATAANAVPSALAAYGHYLGLLAVAMCLSAERLLVAEDMSEDAFDKLAIADGAYGVAGVLVTITGCLRVTQFGKGWEFYQHEPIFWVKMLLFGVAGAASFFPTTKIIQRAVAKRNAPTPPPPMSPKLVARMTSIINAELLAIVSIPLAATLMSRGVLYASWLPWQAGAAPAVLALGGLGYKYVREALEWSDEEVAASATEEVQASVP